GAVHRARNAVASRPSLPHPELRAQRASKDAPSYASVTPALAISSFIAASEPPRSIARQASSRTVALKPERTASSEEYATQKSVARPTSVRSEMPRSRRYPARPVGVVRSFSKKAE